MSFQTLHLKLPSPYMPAGLFVVLSLNIKFNNRLDIMFSRVNGSESMVPLWCNGEPILFFFFFFSSNSILLLALFFSSLEIVKSYFLLPFRLLHLLNLCTHAFITYLSSMLSNLLASPH